jgi:hypothetical protein
LRTRVHDVVRTHLRRGAAFVAMSGLMPRAGGTYYFMGRNSFDGVERRPPEQP